MIDSLNYAPLGLIAQGLVLAQVLTQERSITVHLVHPEMQSFSRPPFL
jgi:hypothetical protein